ncbi:hypothetical protein LINPERHAP2_LOCUS15807 [Linum perenne]
MTRAGRAVSKIGSGVTSLRQKDCYLDWCVGHCGMVGTPDSLQAVPIPQNRWPVVLWRGQGLSMRLWTETVTSLI